VHGDKDNVVRLEDSRSAVQKLENSKLEVVQDLTHDYDTNLEQVSDAAVDWFNTYRKPKATVTLYKKLQLVRRVCNRLVNSC